MYRESLVSQQRKRQKFKVSNLVLGLLKHQEIQHFMNNEEPENQPDPRQVLSGGSALLILQ